MKKTVIYFHSLSSPWAYMGWPAFHALIKKHDLDVVVRPTRIVPPNGGIPLLTRPDARRRYHEVELDRWRKRLNMPLVLRPQLLSDRQPVLRAHGDRGGQARLGCARVEPCVAARAVERGEGRAAMRRCASRSPMRSAWTARSLLGCRTRRTSWRHGRRAKRRPRERGVFGTPTYVFQGHAVLGAGPAGLSRRGAH